jgi:hypothetical protein
MIDRGRGRSCISSGGSVPGWGEQSLFRCSGEPVSQPRHRAASARHEWFLLNHPMYQHWNRHPAASPPFNGAGHCPPASVIGIRSNAFDCTIAYRIALKIDYSRQWKHLFPVVRPLPASAPSASHLFFPTPTMKTALPGDG